MNEAPPAALDNARSLAKAATLITVAALLFSLLHSLVRHITADLHPFEVAFLRFAFSLLFILPWMPRSGAGLRTTRVGLHLLRGALTVSGTLIWFTAITILPLAQAVALNFTVPLFATIGAKLFLGEVVRARRWIATIVGFFGVLIILRPGFGDTTWPMLLPIAAALSMAGSAITMKALTRTDAAITVMFYQNALSVPAFAIIAYFVWQTPSWGLFGLTALTGVLGIAAHYCLTQSFTLAETSFLMPFDYTRLPFTAVVAFVAFGEVPDFWTWAGAAVIAGSAIYISRREAHLARLQVIDRPTTPADAPPH
ncbi:MAG: DMT family transporter [Alphaproteobacteria bacterium]